MELNSPVPPHRRRPTLITFPVASADGFSPPAVVDSHKCDVCGKEFSSYQALGGHKSSHRDKPPAAAGITEIPLTHCNCGPHQLHECYTCGKGFKTGQALGSHMRKHFFRGITLHGGRNSLDGGNGDRSSVVTSFSDGGSASYSGRDGDLTPSPPNFDLNTPPHSPELDLTLKL